jgi:hypothetical protein
MAKTYLLSALFFLALTGLYPIQGSGIRLDHMIIYFLFFIYLINFFFLNKKISFHQHHLYIIFLFLLILFLGVFSASSNLNQNNSYYFFSQIENYFQPIVLIILTLFIVNSFSKYFTTSDFVFYVMKIYLFFMCFNTLLAIVMLNIGVGSYVNYIGGPLDDDGLNVISRSLPAGRSAGVFNQPIDGGVAYSIAMLVWLYLFDKLKNKNSIQFFFILPILLVGSLLVGSKVSQFLGIIFSLFYLVSLGKVLQLLLNYKAVMAFTILFLIGLTLASFLSVDAEIMIYRNLQYFILNRF